ncbi:MAG: bifunctional DNA-formamidopyrimidine glycosylase/DNA-(apurinic or apyrimidinic site) lyase [Desulfurivibrio sp.]|nr:bifunctional DNA-formamidopyrimidine glycosylase/DNA-(apurinic or apyrimidinic site) lyase [Desulfurivibrio sp.]
MPELPEVEVVRRGLEPLVVGRRIDSVEASGLSLRRPVPVAALRRWAVGAVITEVGRRAKYLLLYLDNTALVVIHLGMTGKLYPAAGDQPPRKHDHLCLQLNSLFPNAEEEDQKEEIRFNDCRRFGLVAVYGPEEAAAPPLLAGLGPEPLDKRQFTAAYLYRCCRGRPTPLKNLLMDNRVVVGIGNIYANEILFAAGISPFTPAARIGRLRAGRLVTAAREILTRAIAAGGTTIADFANAAGQAGYFQVQLAVYGRHGTACPRCAPSGAADPPPPSGTASTKKVAKGSKPVIERRVQAGRATFFCPRCQK